MDFGAMHSRPQDKGRNNWLLIKKSDKYAKPGDKDKLLEKENTSIVTRRKMEEIAGAKHGKIWQSNKAEKAPKKEIKKKPKLPDFIEPQLATLSDKMPKGKNWLHEIKFDGYRTIARVSDKTTLHTRTGLDWTHKYKAIARELQKLGHDCILDGEIIALDDKGQSNFMELQKTLKDERDAELQYYVFDLLYLDGEDYRDKPLIERKKTLQKILPKLRNIFYSEHFTKQHGFYEKACQLGLEGVISKQADDKYRSGRGKSWLKSKCHKRQEMVIGGFTLPSKGNRGIGVLLVGYYKNGKLIYANKCGTGFDFETSLLLRKKLEALKTQENPFEKVTPIGRRGAIWVKPKLVCEIEFTEWTSDGAMRHPSFQGLREDKPATEIKREKEIQLDSNTVKTKIKAKSKQTTVVAGTNISHPDRVIYPEQNITKLQVAQYYEAIADYILPYIKDHLISAIRCQEDITKECFFQRHAGTVQNKYLKEVKVKDHGDNQPYIALDSKEGLLSLIQAGIIEIHPWGSHINDITKPDRIIFDFDPDPELEWKYVADAAKEMRTRLKKLGLESYLKTTGGKGLHVTVPLKPKYDWDVMKPWAKAIAESMVKDNPKLYTANMSKAGRKGKIFIDYLRNGLTSTAVAAYSLRARDGATVALPLDWKELTPKLNPKKFNLETMPAILKKRKDPWKDFYKNRQNISEAMIKRFIK